MLVEYPEFHTAVQNMKKIHAYSAESLSRQGFYAFLHIVKVGYQRYQHMSDYTKVLSRAKKELLKAQPGEPLLRNILEFVFNEKEMLKCQTMKQLYDFMMLQAHIVEVHFEDVYKKIPLIGMYKIKDNMTVYTHCHSSNVVNLLTAAHNKGALFRVYTTEARPLLQGRETAKELAAAGMNVHELVDGAMASIVIKSDIILLGCDAIDSELRAYSAIGSRAICEVARNYNKPVYLVTDSWKYDSHNTKEHIEKVDPHTIWKKIPDNVIVESPESEVIPPHLIQGVICELGILPVKELKREINKRYPFF